MAESVAVRMAVWLAAPALVVAAGCDVTFDGRPGVTGTPTTIASVTSQAPARPASARLDGWLIRIPAIVQIDDGLVDDDGPLRQQLGGGFRASLPTCDATDPATNQTAAIAYEAGSFDRLSAASETAPESRTLDTYANNSAAEGAIRVVRDRLEDCAQASGLDVRTPLVGESSLLVAGDGVRWQLVRVGNAVLRVFAVGRESPQADTEVLRRVVNRMCVFSGGGCGTPSFRLGDSGRRVDPVGVGDLLLGLSTAQVGAVDGVTLGPEVDGVVPVRSPLAGEIGNGCLRRVTLPADAVLTPSGVRVGDHLADVKRAFTFFRRALVPDELQVTALDTGPSSSSFVFTVAGGVVTEIAIAGGSCRPEVPDDASVLTPDGVGDVRLGMSRADALALPGAAILEEGHGGCDSFAARPRPGARGLFGGALGRTLVSVYNSAIDADSYDALPSLYTARGITEGSLLGEVEAAYPAGRLVVARQSPDHWVTPVPGRDDRFLDFTIEEGVVFSFDVQATAARPVC